MIATTGEEKIVGTPTTEYENNAFAGCEGFYFAVCPFPQKREIM